MPPKPKRRREPKTVTEDTRDRNWVFTLNNYTREECDFIVAWSAKWKYGVVGFETGESGTPHLQGALWLLNSMTFRAVKAKLPRAHVEPMDYETSAAYCAKDGDLLVDNKPPVVRQGRRTDLDRAKEMLAEGKSMETIALNVNYQAARHAELILRHKRYESRWMADRVVIWVWGGPGTGKTRWAMSHPDSYLKDHSKWWQNYDGHGCVVFDDWRKDTCPWAQLLRWLDKYNYYGETKGGYVEIKATTIIVTAPTAPDVMFKDLDENLAQLTRRIDHVYEASELPEIEPV